MDGQHLQDLHNTLLQIFSDRISLAKWVRFRLDEQLNVFASESNLSDTVFQLLDWAVAHGRLDDVINAVEAEQRTAMQRRIIASQANNAVVVAPILGQAAEDWGEAPDVQIFYGREDELTQLVQWLTVDHCRLVGVFGMGGIGKTALIAKLGSQVRPHFERVFWRSLLNAPLLGDILTECIRFLSGGRNLQIPEDYNKQIMILLEQLRTQRCLLILDNVEGVLQKENYAGIYRAGYENYGTFILRIGESLHQSCVVINGREKPAELEQLESNTGPVRSLELGGLQEAAGKDLLRERGLFGTQEEWARLIEHYSGNPLALKIIGSTIRDLFRGNIARYLRRAIVVWGNVRDLLDQQFDRLSEHEQEIMYWLAIIMIPTNATVKRRNLK